MVVRYASLRILVFSDWFPEHGGDAAGIFVRDHALAVARRHEVVVLHLRAPTSGAGRPRLEETSDGPLRVLRVRGGPGAPMTALNLWATATALRRLRREAATPDLLHAHETAGGVVAAVTGRVLNRPVVLSEHSSEFALETVHGVAAHASRFAFAGADVVCPVSESLRTTLESGHWGGRYRVVPNVIDTDLFTVAKADFPSGQPPLVVTVASLEPVKGVQDLVEALGLLRSRGVDLRVALIGDGSLRPALVQRAQALGLGERLVFRGPLPRRDVATLMRDAAFAVVPSRWETFSVVLGEAMATGLPVVATAVGGMTERVDAGNGVLCPPRDPESLAAGIEEMLGTYHSYERYAIASEVSARYSPEAIALRWEEVYGEAIESRLLRSRARRRASS